MAQIAKDAEVLALGLSGSAGRRCRGQTGTAWPALRNCKQALAETGGLLKPGVSVTSFSVRWLRFLVMTFQLQPLPLHVFYVLDEWATLSNMYTKLTFVRLEILAFIRSTKSGIRGRRTDGPTPRHPAFLGHGVNLFRPFKAFLGIDLMAISGESWSTHLFPLGCMTRAILEAYGPYTVRQARQGAPRLQATSTLEAWPAPEGRMFSSDVVCGFWGAERKLRFGFNEPRCQV